MDNGWQVSDTAAAQLNSTTAQSTLANGTLASAMAMVPSSIPRVSDTRVAGSTTKPTVKALSSTRMEPCTPVAGTETCSRDADRRRGLTAVNSKVSTSAERRTDMEYTAGLTGLSTRAAGAATRSQASDTTSGETGRPSWVSGEPT